MRTSGNARLAILSDMVVDLMQERADIKAGRLVPVLEQFNPGDCEDMHVRAFIDFLSEHVRIGNPAPTRARRPTRGPG